MAWYGMMGCSFRLFGFVWKLCSIVTADSNHNNKILNNLTSQINSIFNKCWWNPRLVHVWSAIIQPTWIGPGWRGNCDMLPCLAYYVRMNWHRWDMNYHNMWYKCRKWIDTVGIEVDLRLIGDLSCPRYLFFWSTPIWYHMISFDHIYPYAHMHIYIIYIIYDLQTFLTQTFAMVLGKSHHFPPWTWPSCHVTEESFASFANARVRRFQVTMGLWDQLGSRMWMKKLAIACGWFMIYVGSVI